MKLQEQVKWQVKMKLQVQVQVKMKVKVKVKYKLVKLSGSPRKNRRAEKSGSTSRTIEQEKSITSGCAPNGCVRLAEWESCNCAWLNRG